MRTIIFILLFLSLYFGIWIFIGIKWAIAVCSLLLMSLATSFILKKDFYVRYIEFVNPKCAALYNYKDDNFKRKLRKTDIIVLYILSAIMVFISVNIPNTILPIHGIYLIYLIVIEISVCILLWLFGLLILKKSRKYSSFWFYSIALILFIILVLAIIQNFIF